MKLSERQLALRDARDLVPTSSSGSLSEGLAYGDIRSAQQESVKD